MWEYRTRLGIHNFDLPHTRRRALTQHAPQTSIHTRPQAFFYTFYNRSTASKIVIGSFIYFTTLRSLLNSKWRRPPITPQRYQFVRSRAGEKSEINTALHGDHVGCAESPKRTNAHHRRNTGILKFYASVKFWRDKKLT